MGDSDYKQLGLWRDMKISILAVATVLVLGLGAQALAVDEPLYAQSQGDCDTADLTSTRLSIGGRLRTYSAIAAYLSSLSPIPRQ